jgi:flagellar biogenesis protein FliO
MNNKPLNLFIRIISVFAFALFVLISAYSGICYGAADGGGYLLKRLFVSKSKSPDSYLIWFKFNKKPERIVKKLEMKGYGIELTFKNASSAVNSKFIKFKNNRLFKAVEILPSKDSGLNAVIYFHKNIKIAKKNTYATFYGSYFIIKIHHSFPENLFKNVGKKSLKAVSYANKVKPAIAAAAAADKISGHSGHSTAMDHSKQNADSSGSFFSAKHAPKLNIGLEAVKTAVYLALIVGMIYGIYFLLNKFKNRVAVKEKINDLKIVSSINLGNKKSMLLLEANKEFFLVGVSPANIQVIGHLKGSRNTAGVKELSPNALHANASVKPDGGNETSDFADYRVNAGDGSDTYAEAAFMNPSPQVASYGKFADVMREQVNSRSEDSAVEYEEPKPTGIIRRERPYGGNKEVISQVSGVSDMFKVKNINEAKYKNKADNVFFDIEERLKGLMESNDNDFTRSGAGNSKKI